MDPGAGFGEPARRPADRKTSDGRDQQQQGAAPEVGIDVDVKARQIAEEAFEVVLVLKVQARVAGEVAFLVELEYGGVVTIRGVPQDVMAALVLIETPRLLFPFARAIVADATREGGFPPLLINPIDFTELQRRKAAEAEAAETQNA